VVDALFERLGIWRAQDVHGLVNAVELSLACGQRPSGRLVVMSHSGAVGVLSADTAEQLKLPLAELSLATLQALSRVMPGFATAGNPVDLTASLLTDGGMFAATLEALAADPQADLFLVGVPVAGEGYDIEGMARDTARFMVAHGKPTAVSAPQASVRDAFRRAGVPVFGHESDALAALHQLSRHARLQQQALHRSTAMEGLPLLPHLAAAAPQSGPATLSEADSLAVLRHAGIPLAPHRLCRTAQEAIAAWRELGPEVVLKACSAHIPHKSEHGLVFLGLDSGPAVAEAFEQCVARVRALGVPLEGVIVARRVRGRREFALGVRQDPAFGAVVMVSDGGKYVEALRDFAVLLHPFTEQDVLDKLAALRIAPILAGVRGEPPVDLAVVARCAVALGRLAAAHPDAIAAIDLNPLIVGSAGEGGWAVDAVVELTGGRHA
jgi:acyl-CoA synthetase (NDP forming)